MLVDAVSRWSVLAFAAAHVLGLLTHHPVPWSATLTAAALLVVAGAGTARASTGPLRRLALLAGLAAVTGLVAVTEFRGGGLGWPFFLTEAPAGGTTARAEAALLTAAVLGLSAAALLPEHGAGGGLRARLRSWFAERRAGILDLRESGPGAGPPADPAWLDPERDPAGFDPKRDPAGLDPKRDPAGLDPERDPAGFDPKRDPAGLDPGPGPAVLDLGVLGPDAVVPVTGSRPPRDPGWWRSRLAAAGTVAAAALVTAVAAGPMWRPDPYGKLPLTSSRDLAGLLLATVPVLLAAVAGTVAAGRSLHRPAARPGTARRGTALAAGLLVLLAVPVARARAGEHRFSPEPPPAQTLYIATLSGIGEVPSDRPAWLPPAFVHPPGARAASPADLLDGAWDDGWDGSTQRPREWAPDRAREDRRDGSQDATLAALTLLVLVALTTVALPSPDAGGPERG
ncbi:hypothetical protein Daura_34185 [Dactylosporangium aurantiacum]|uniref:Uncharacterized protein n=1 Tax=Dactylosporangium aurantiacum TaxID=35754 RepID=A0A9Q9IC98_9ACTN|nr:hypothetical protein [Dactylosporangium aurantiacum]MDG6105242.1 hypothetical protein [Dactylosporangium aurantiacum]UWZ51755.1 hypothetical protein Daura_34185 [Dactylosporangium aurantiacum]